MTDFTKTLNRLTTLEQQRAEIDRQIAALTVAAVVWP